MPTTEQAGTAESRPGDERYSSGVVSPSTEELLSQALGSGPAASEAWEQIVRRYSGLVWKVVRSFRLNHDDSCDAFQATWLRALERLSTVREPERFAGWLAAVAKNEVHSKVLRPLSRATPTDEVPEPLIELDVGEHEARLVREELIEAVRAGFAELDDDAKQLLTLLSTDPPLKYREIELVLGRPHGWIGPTRRRCLERLRRTPAVAAYLASLAADLPVRSDRKDPR